MTIITQIVSLRILYSIKIDLWNNTNQSIREDSTRSVYFFKIFTFPVFVLANAFGNSCIEMNYQCFLFMSCFSFMFHLFIFPIVGGCNHSFLSTSGK